MYKEMKPNKTVVCTKTGKPFRMIDGKIYQISLEWKPDDFIEFLDDNCCTTTVTRFEKVKIWEQFYYDNRVWVKTKTDEAISEDGEEVEFCGDCYIDKLKLTIESRINQALKTNDYLTFETSEIHELVSTLQKMNVLYDLSVCHDHCGVSNIRK